MNSELNQTRDSYDQFAVEIADGFWEFELTDTWNTFSQSLPEGAKVADIGCGPGRDTGQFTQRGFWTTGLDFSSGMLHEAMRRAPAPYLQGDMRTLPYATGAFDGAWVCASLLHIPRKEVPGVLTEIWRVLKPGGTIYLALKEGKGEIWDSRKGERFFTFFQEGEIRNLLDNAGFEIFDLVINPGEKINWINIFARKSA